jgi:hypothetical protein
MFGVRGITRLPRIVCHYATSRLQAAPIVPQCSVVMVPPRARQTGPKSPQPLRGVLTDLSPLGQPNSAGRGFPVFTHPEPSPPKSRLSLRPMEDEKEHHHGEAAKRIDE